MIKKLVTSSAANAPTVASNCPTLLVPSPSFDDVVANVVLQSFGVVDPPPAHLLLTLCMLYRTLYRPLFLLALEVSASGRQLSFFRAPFLRFSCSLQAFLSTKISLLFWLPHPHEACLLCPRPLLLSAAFFFFLDVRDASFFPGFCAFPQFSQCPPLHPLFFFGPFSLRPPHFLAAQPLLTSGLGRVSFLYSSQRPSIPTPSDRFLRFSGSSFSPILRLFLQTLEVLVLSPGRVRRHPSDDCLSSSTLPKLESPF